MFTLPHGRAFANRTSSAPWGAGKWVIALAGSVLCCGFAPDWGMQAGEAPGEAPVPGLSSLFPVSVQRGRVLEMEVRGKDLEKCYGVWFGTKGLSGEVTRIEGMQFLEKEKPAGAEGVGAGAAGVIEGAGGIGGAAGEA